MKPTLRALHAQPSIAPASTVTILRKAAFVTLTLGLASLLVTGCSKEVGNEATGNEEQLTQGISLNMYPGLQQQTQQELQQAKAATAKYQNVENALRDGYQDIAVDVQHMGHHYMNMDLVTDGVFDPKKPEILVYNRNDRGQQELVAVEYAVPIDLPMPEGFTGSSDVWNDNSGFQFHLVHAWIWAYNPDGVFAWTNPLIELH